MDHAVAQGNVVRVVIDTAKAAARNVEPFEHVMIRQAEFNRVRAARDHRTQPVNSNPSDSNLVHCRTRYSENQITWIRRVAVDLNHITRLKRRCDVLQFLQRSSWTN